MACGSSFNTGIRAEDIDGFPIKFTDLTLLGTYADRAGSSDVKASNVKNVRSFVMGALATNRLTYCKSKANDCGAPSKVSLGAAATGIKQSSTGVQALSGVLGPGVFASSGALAGVTAGLSLLAIPILAIGAHHAQAVKTEQDTLCMVSNTWNAFADAAETALINGKINEQDALASLVQIYQQLTGTLSGIEGKGTTGCNAGCFFHKALDALKIWNEEVVFPSLEKSSTSSLLSSSGTGSKAVLAGAGVAVAHFAGVF